MWIAKFNIQKRVNRSVWRCAMRNNLRIGEQFQDIELPNHEGDPTKLSSLIGGFPVVVVFSRGEY